MTPTKVRVTTTPENMIRAIGIFIHTTLRHHHFGPHAIGIEEQEDDYFVSEAMPEELASAVINDFNERMKKERMDDTTEAIVEW